MSRAVNRRALMAAAGALALTGSAVAAPRPDDMVLGRANAPIEVVEYASLTCPHCARFHAEVFPAFKRKYVDTGRVKFIFRELPTPPIQVATAGFLMARCAGQAKYFKVIDEIFRSQDTWYGSPGGPLAALRGIAKANGMSEAQFQTCITDSKQVDALTRRVSAAIGTENVRATPTFFVNGKKVKEGEITMEEFDAAIAAAGRPGGR